MVLELRFRPQRTVAPLIRPWLRQQHDTVQDMGCLRKQYQERWSLKVLISMAKWSL